MIRRRGEKGQATTEVVLLLPMFMFFLFAFAKVFALLILVQKLQIASFYAARRWQLQSHRAASYEWTDNTVLLPAISNQVCTYLGYAPNCSKPPAGQNFLDLGTNCIPSGTCSNSTTPGVTVQRTAVWNVVTTTVCTGTVSLVFYQTQGFTFCDTKYVPNRDRPIAFVLPGLPGGP